MEEAPLFNPHPNLHHGILRTGGALVIYFEIGVEISLAAHFGCRH